MKTWDEFRKELDITPEDENQIRFEKELILTMIKIREEKGLTQAQLAQMCGVKQPVIARMETATHSPRIDSLLKVLTQLGYTLKIVPVEAEGQR
ncbi:MAG: helix-turn-helix domain-containing protein [Lachnospiraceae bacterium]|nr:helix-turn-helix domain-containing protein [Lachnospiraceae bacterium]